MSRTLEIRADDVAGGLVVFDDQDRSAERRRFAVAQELRQRGSIGRSTPAVLWSPLTILRKSPRSRAARAARPPGPLSRLAASGSTQRPWRSRDRERRRGKSAGSRFVRLPRDRPRRVTGAEAISVVVRTKNQPPPSHLVDRMDTDSGRDGGPQGQPAAGTDVVRGDGAGSGVRQVGAVAGAVDHEPARRCLGFTDLADGMQGARGANAVRRRCADPTRTATGVGDDRLTAGAEPEAVRGRSCRRGVAQTGEPAVRRSP